MSSMLYEVFVAFADDGTREFPITQDLEKAPEESGAPGRHYSIGPVVALTKRVALLDTL